MADNFQISQGSGTSIAADDISSVYYQRVKIAQGADGVGVDVSSSAPLQVTLANTGSNATAVNVADNGGSLTVDAPVGTPVFVRLSDGSSAIATLPVSLASVPSHAVTNAGTFAVQAAQSGTWTVQPGNTANTTPWLTTPTPATSGGLSVANFNTGDTYTALTNSAQAIKASAGQFYGYYIYNPNSSATYVMVYNVAHGSVTVGTTTAQMVFCIPATSGANLDLTHGIAFSTAMSIAAATTGGGNTAPTTALEAMVFYK